MNSMMSAIKKITVGAAAWIMLLHYCAATETEAKMLCDFSKLKNEENKAMFNESGELVLNNASFAFPANGNINPRQGCVEFEFKPNWTADKNKRADIILFSVSTDLKNSLSVSLKGIDLYSKYTVGGKNYVHVYNGCGFEAGKWYKFVLNYDTDYRIVNGAKMVGGVMLVNDENRSFVIEQGKKFDPLPMESAKIGFGLIGNYECRLDGTVRNFKIYDRCRGVETRNIPEFEPEMSKLRQYEDVSAFSYLQDFNCAISSDDSPVHFSFVSGNSYKATFPNEREFSLVKITLDNSKRPGYSFAHSFALYSGDNAAYYRQIPILGVKEVRKGNVNDIYYKIDCKTRYVKIYNQDSADIIASLPKYEFYGDTAVSGVRKSGVSLLGKQNGISFWHASPTNKIMRDDAIPSTVSRQEIKLSGARGEIESFQLAATSGKDSKTKFSVEFSDLTAGENLKIARSNIQVSRVGYINITEPSVHSFAAEWPDCLFDESETVLAKGNNPLWVSVKIPRETTPGKYKGPFKIRLDDRDVYIGDLEVNVYNFTLPLKPALRSMTVFRKQYIDKYCPAVTTEDCFRLFSRNRIGGVVNYPVIRSAKIDGGVTLDTKPFEEMENFYFNECNFNIFGLSDIYLGECGTAYKFKEEEFMSEKYKMLLADYLVKTRDYLKRKGRLDSAVLYLVDEPWLGELDKFEKIFSFVKNTTPEYKTLLTAAPLSGSLMRYVDIWCERSIGEPASRKNIKDSGSTAFAYMNSSYEIDRPGMTTRTLGWALNGMGAKGYLFWGICAWGAGNPLQFPAVNVSDNQMQAVSNGQGWLFYPSPDGKKLLPSIRSELIRDSFEDYDYFHLLREHLKKDIALKEYKLGQALLEEAETLVPDNRTYPNEEMLITMRNRIGDYLDKYAPDK